MAFSVFLESAADGRCMAHVVDLPGCTTWSATRELALSQIPQAIREYHAWLRRHEAVSAPTSQPIEWQVTGESLGTGPFDPGDAVALFPQDREPISQSEAERFLCLMAYSRSDLLALVRGLTHDVLDREPARGASSIRRILRHMGNAEEWYISRIVPPDKLPGEWKDDETLPIFEFMEMERRTAVEQLRSLDDAQQSGIFYPSEWTDHSEEGWTARKVLRRFVEHEREHTRQIRTILAAAGIPSPP